jgi:hypothetical protein
MGHSALIGLAAWVDNAYETTKRILNLEAMELIREYEPDIAR